MNSNDINKTMNQGNNKNRRHKYLNQNKLWNSQNFNSNNLINIGSFQNGHLTNDPLNPPVYAPVAPLFGSTNSVPGTHQPYPNTHFPPSPFMLTQPCEPYYYTNTPLIDKQIEQYERKRHGSYDSYLGKTQQSYQQVPQHTPVQSHAVTSHINQNHGDLNNGSSNNYLLMPAPNVATTPLPPQPPQPSFASTHSNPSGHIPRSYSCHGGISSAAYESNQSTNNGPVYIDFYIPQQHPSSAQIYPQNGTPIIVPSSQTLLANGTTTSSFTSNCLDNKLGYLS